MPPKKTSAKNTIDPELKPSRSAKKRDSAAIQKLGEELIALSPQERRELDLDEELLEALALCDRVTDREGARRQRQYVGKLTRRMDIERIEKFLTGKKDAKELETARFRKAEKLRLKLTQTPDAQLDKELNELDKLFAAAENAAALRAKSRELLALARKGTSPDAIGASRELFRLILDAMQAL